MQIGNDILDSREVQARCDELQEEHADLKDALDEAQGELDSLDADASEADKTAAQDAVDAAEEALSDWIDSNESEFEALKTLCEEGSNYAGGWQHGAALVKDSYFVEYAQQLASDMHGTRACDSSWPFNCIDWDQAANLLKQDYTEISAGGESYWVQS